MNNFWVINLPRTVASVKSGISKDSLELCRQCMSGKIILTSVSQECHLCQTNTIIFFETIRIAVMRTIEKTFLAGFSMFYPVRLN